ncbi:hypothetical protein KC887_01235 [Candidatus Kaiserbacteria bacterium]|nr:hypothetical protein [Candidatus Kaiserbacteria bacterium]
MSKPALYGLPPLIVTFEQLVFILQPLTMGYAWGENAIRDLWLLGAPIPTSNPLAPTKRIVFPGKLAEWLADVLEKKGQPLDVGATAYASLLKQSV